MKTTENSEFKPRKKLYFIIIIIALAIILLYFFIQRDYLSTVLSVLQPIIIGAVIAYLLNPIVKVLEKPLNRGIGKIIKKEKTCKHLSRGISITVSLLALFAVVTAIIWLIVPQLITSINNLIVDLPDKINGATEFYNKIVEKYDLPNRINEFSNWYAEMFGNSESQFDISTVLTSFMTKLQEGIIKSVGTVGSGLISLVSTLINVVIGLIVTVYLLACKETMFGQIKKLMYAFADNDKVNSVIETSRECNLIVSRFIVGKIIDSAIIGVLCFILMLILRMPYPVLISVVIGVTDIIPFFGPYIGAIPSTLLILLSDPLKAVYFVIMIIVLQQAEGNLISPKIIGDSIGLSPFWVMFAMIFGGGMFGLIGMLLGVPVLAIIFFIIKKISDQKLREKNMPISSSAYAESGIISADDDEDNRQ